MEWTNPTIIASASALATVLLTKGIDLWLARRKSRDEVRHGDRELLSADEKDFRTTIIKQLQQCHDSNANKDVKIAELSSANITLSARVASLEIELQRVKNSVGAALEEGAEAVKHAVEQVAVAIDLSKVEEKK